MPKTPMSIADYAQQSGEFGNIESAVAITPHDSNEQPEFRAVYVGGAGNISVTFRDGTSVVFTAVPVGTLLPIRPLRINATNTTATLMIGCL